jgi:hypothetical protein
MIKLWSLFVNVQLKVDGYSNIQLTLLYCCRLAKAQSVRPPQLALQRLRSVLQLLLPMLPQRRIVK